MNNMSDVIIGKGNLAGRGVYAERNFKKGDIVIQYDLTLLTDEAYKNLSESERMFTHSHYGVTYLYSEPERYVNHSENPNTCKDLKKRCDVALHGIKRGEEITTDATKDDVATHPSLGAF